MPRGRRQTELLMLVFAVGVVLLAYARLGAAGLLLLAIPAVWPASHSAINGAKVWILLGPIKLEPGEFAKLALAVFFAGSLVAKRDVLALAGRRFLGLALPGGRDLGPVLIAWAASMLILIFETDIGMSALFFGLFLAMIYVATQRTSWLLIGVALFLFGAFVASNLIGHVGERFDIWLHPFAGLNPTHNAYQLVQGLEGMGFGGILGTGLGQGQPFLTPLAQSDFIVTAFGEELGLAGLRAMLLNVNYVQAFQANSLAGEPGNSRVFDQQFQYQRGSIIAVGDGSGHEVTIAGSRPVKGTNTYHRYYPSGPAYAPVTGYDSIFGKTGIEGAEQKYLAGTPSCLTVHNLSGLLTGKPEQAATANLTISAKAQPATNPALPHEQQQ